MFDRRTDGGGPVIAVLGCGVDVAYPAKNRGLFEDIRYHGCLISEFPPGTPPYPDNFPVRNRILSGISVGVVVVEAPKKSGALITASRALEPGARCVCAAANVGSPTSEGNLQLLKDGATLISEGADVMREYALLYPDRIAFQPPAVSDDADRRPRRRPRGPKSWRRNALSRKKSTKKTLTIWKTGLILTYRKFQTSSARMRRR